MKLRDLYNNGVIAYHGSDHKISTFSTEFVTDFHFYGDNINVGGNGMDVEGPGIYFSTDPVEAGTFGDNFYKVLLQPRKLVPLKGRINVSQVSRLILIAAGLKRTSELVGMDIDRFYTTPLCDFDEDPVRAFRQAVEAAVAYGSPHDAFLSIWSTHFRYAPRKYLQAMVKLGYDGVRVPRRGCDYYVVFNPEIINLIG